MTFIKEKMFLVFLCACISDGWTVLLKLEIPGEDEEKMWIGDG